MKLTTPIILLICIAGWSLSHQKVSAAKYIKWVEDPENGFIQEQNAGSLIYRLKYQPATYKAILAIGKPTVRKNELRQSLETLEGLQYFTLQIKHQLDAQVLELENKSGMDNLSYFSFQMQERLQLIENDNRLPCALFHLEPSFGISPYLTIVLAFEREQGSENATKVLVYDDQHFGFGELSFQFSDKILANLPTLKTY